MAQNDAKSFSVTLCLLKSNKRKPKITFLSKESEKEIILPKNAQRKPIFQILKNRGSREIYSGNIGIHFGFAISGLRAKYLGPCKLVQNVDLKTDCAASRTRAALIGSTTSGWQCASSRELGLFMFKVFPAVARFGWSRTGVYLRLTEVRGPVQG